MWSVFEPVMFCLIGGDIDTAVLDGDMVGLAVGCIFVSLAVRAEEKKKGEKKKGRVRMRRARSPAPNCTRVLTQLLVLVDLPSATSILL